MNNIYYMIWVDAIQSIRKHHPHKKTWKKEIFILITWMHALNFWIILLWLKYFKVLILPILDIDIFPGDMLDGFFSFAFEFALPVGLLNYFFVFRNNRYEEIIDKYKHVKIRYGLIYSVSMSLGAFLSAILYGILT